MIYTAASLIALGAASAGQAKQFYKLSSLAPGATPYVVNTTFVKVIQKYNPDIEIQVNATGAATRHALDAARGKIQFFMAPPIIHFLMTKKLAMFKKVKDAPELAKNLRTIFNYPIGAYHFAVYADSGITDMRGLKGKRIFLGPKTGAARTVAKGIFESVTGYKAGVDYKEAMFNGFGPARQAFQDKQLDMMVDPSNPPSATFSQIALTNKIRFLGLSDSDWKLPGVQKVMKLPGRTPGVIPAGAYGKNQVNEKDVHTVSAWVGLGTTKFVPDEVVYKMTKTFWEHISEVQQAAPWMKDAIKLENVFVKINMKLHPGAYKYYKEIGLKIPEVAVP